MEFFGWLVGLLKTGLFCVDLAVLESTVDQAGLQPSFALEGLHHHHHHHIPGVEFLAWTFCCLRLNGRVSPRVYLYHFPVIGQASRMRPTVGWRLG